MRMKRKPPCKYCGADMELQDTGTLNAGGYDAFYNFWCPKCGSESPMKNTKKEAYEAACEDPHQKPMTLQEVIRQKAIWYEPRNGTPRPMIIDGDKKSDAMKESYNVIWRGWRRWPSREDQEAAEWEDEKND